MTLFIGGLPCIIAAILLISVLNEPSRSNSGSERQTQKSSDLAADRTPTLTETFRFVASQRAVVYLFVQHVLSLATMAAGSTWLVSFFIRIFHLSLADAGAAVALGYGVLGGIGTLLGGIITDRAAAHDARWKIWITTLAMVAGTACASAMVLVPTAAAAIVLMALWSIFVHAQFGPVWGLSQSLAPPRMRGRLGSVFSGGGTLFGFALGPILAGLLSQWLTPAFGAQSIRYALLLTNVLNIAVILCSLAVARHLRADLVRAERPIDGTHDNCLQEELP